ncbi:nicotinate-nucleotide adenylyltransferase [Consotaella salsifontis]|uniref:Probable nicotinate-nucleotide adenylyltransferase n=1 Tax=Consotaella salsifontis TaxID=1365950 RepID=A0A1T4RX26_9HYPH|nr:nicotinate-nucleotide adenylyltransferase [Consotaella salsifontis]SKA20416.1 nicotinate-nucleotide adenylyltransferase [Consotaella salsifontis]
MTVTEGVPADALKLPHTEPGLRVGLFGGSFNPPHAGHLLVAETAMRKLGLDRLWWMVTPGNPLKSHGELAPLAERLAASRIVARNPRIDVTAFEAAHRIRYTADALALIKAKKPDIAFVWIMGADSLATFHLWQRWRWIARTFALAVVDRPGATLSFLSSPMAVTFQRSRVDEEQAASVLSREPPAWVFLHGPRSALSSTALRKSNVRHS